MRMSRLGKVALWVVGVLVVAGALAWHFQDEIVLAAIGFATDRALPVGPNQPIAWETGADPAGRAPGERPPNIVIILADDLGWNDLSVGGGGVAGGRAPTPHIDSIARDGVRFLAGYSANGTCAPSRASIMSGRYATRFGFEFTPTPAGMTTMLPYIARRMPGRLRFPVRTDGGSALPFNEMGMPASEISIAELLKPAGYHTVHIGKWHLGGVNGMSAHAQGFDESLLMASGLYLPVDDPNVVNSRQDFDPIDRFLWRAIKYAASFNDGPAFAPRGYLTDYYTDEAVKVIEANKDRPFLLYLAYWAPHIPLQATKADYDALSQIEDPRLRTYAAMIRALDRGVGRVLDALKANGLDDNTLVFFTSDNGAPNYIGLPDVNRPYRGWKITFFEGGIHVPYFLRWPKQVAAGQTYTAPVHGFDIYATAAAAAGVPLPPDERASNDAWLFDLDSDPTEQHNLAEREPARLAELRDVLAAHDAEQAPPLWPSLAEMPVNIDKTLLEPDAPDDEYIYWPN
jgi:arylsulfatase A-like enzyme